MFASPLIDWDSHEMRVYRAEHRLPESSAAALLHRSGECNCGSFAADGERAMIKALYPSWWASTIAALEDQAQAAGIRWCRWGGYDIHGNRAGATTKRRGAGLLCESCEARQHPAKRRQQTTCAPKRSREVCACEPRRAASVRTLRSGARSALIEGSDATRANLDPAGS